MLIYDYASLDVNTHHEADRGVGVHDFSICFASNEKPASRMVGTFGGTTSNTGEWNDFRPHDGGDKKQAVEGELNREVNGSVILKSSRYGRH